MLILAAGYNQCFFCKTKFNYKMWACQAQDLQEFYKIENANLKLALRN